MTALSVNAQLSPLAGGESATAAALEQQAAAGNVDAMFRLGISYATGRGAPLDLQKARFWFNKSADGGHAGAKQQLLGLELQPAASTTPVQSNQPSQNTQTVYASGGDDNIRLRMSEQDIKDVHQYVTSAVLNQKHVHVSGYQRGNSYVNEYTRQPPGGITFRDELEANLYGAAAVAFLSVVDYALQKWDNYTKKKQEPEQISATINSYKSARGTSNYTTASEHESVPSDAEAQFQMGLLLVTMSSLELNKAKAKYYFEQAAALGHVGAKQELIKLAK